LEKLGVVSEVRGNLLRIQGGKPLRGAKVQALDLRAGVALTLAGLVAEGETVIDDAWQIERGYDNFVDKLRSLGGDINRS
jgi:UDP-N-acetylglucosamine 1-carboxyvinyltransferase